MASIIAAISRELNRVYLLYLSFLFSKRMLSRRCKSERRDAVGDFETLLAASEHTGRNWELTCTFILTLFGLIFDPHELGLKRQS